MKKTIMGLMMVGLVVSLTGCGTNSNLSNSTGSSSVVASSSGILSTSDLFTSRDLEQTADTSEATTYQVSDGKDITITTEGVYVITGSSKNTTIIVDTSDDAKVEIVLSDVTVTNDNSPCIYVKNADKVFVTTVGSNSLTVTGTFTSNDTTNTDAVIFAKDDLVLKGTGTLNINSTDNGITCKDDLKITGGTINITSVNDALEANNSVAIYDGNIKVNSKKDGIHVEYSEDNTVGYVYITGGTLDITATDDGMHAITAVQIDDGEININAREGIEGTYIQINGGTIKITASDDGINAANQTSLYTPTIEITGGNLTIDMGQGDTDAIDANGNIYISGGTIGITGESPFDYDGEAKYTGGTIIVNGEEVNTITNQMMGGPSDNSGQTRRR